MVADGFEAHSGEHSAPDYAKRRVCWVVTDEAENVLAVLTANVLWDWMYIDELWASSAARGKGHGRQLMELAEEHALSQNLQGIWLWTQSWQAESFYKHLGYQEFARFDNFPKGHERIGFRKALQTATP